MRDDACTAIQEVDEHLVVLRNVAPELKKAMKWTQMIEPAATRDEKWTLMDCPKGIIIYKVLSWETEKSVMDNVASADSEYPKHAHKGIEIFQVYEGELIVVLNGDEIRVKSVLEGGKPYYIDSGVEHWGYCEVKTKFIATTIPGDLGWQPHGQ